MRTKEERELPRNEERVWVHFWNERFLNHWKSKLDPRGDGTFQILEKFIDNAYEIDFPNKYQVNPTFNNFYLSPYAEPDFRMNHFEEGGNHTFMIATFNEQSQVKFQEGLEKLSDPGWKVSKSLSKDSARN